jgi:tetratricopeptide (TPR) repeat protein/predicted Ser/Thr protein kinase
VGSDPATTTVESPPCVDFDEDAFVGAERIDRYLLLEPIGAGGMGRVYRAIDPELERPVAIKALRRRDPRLVTRLRREAQALAQLHSPYVVEIYDVIVRDEALFIAMELVRGPTLSVWARQASWREKLAVLLQAGEGVVAAHQAGLLHRDLKPSNILVGDDGRVRVMDFGLVLGVASASRDPGLLTPDLADPQVETRLTDHEHVIGTLPYMAPEQHSGHADERSDQFAFCVTAFEILYGVRPFPAGTRKQQLAAKEAGDIWQPTDSDVPLPVHRAICRGLAAKPDDRWPSMVALLAALRRTSLRKRRWAWMGAGAGALAIAGGVSWAWMPQQACADDRLRGVWDGERREQARVAILDSGSSHAQPTWDRIERGLDAYARRWVDARAQTCGNEAQLDGRMRCLGQRRTELSALVDTLLVADPTVVDHAVGAVASLLPVEVCSDAEMLEPTHPDPIAAERADALRADLARAKMLGDAGRLEQGLALATTVRTRASTLGDARLLAEAHVRVARLHSALDRWEDAAESHRAAYFAARRIDASDLAAESATALVHALGKQLGRYDEAATWAEHARVEVERLGDGKAEVQLELAEGMLRADRGEYDVALQHYARARASAERLDDDDNLVGSTLNSVGAAQYHIGRYDASLASLREALSRTEAQLGPEHPAMATVLTNLGSTYEARGDEEAAIDHYERALAIREAAYGPAHPSLATTLINLGTVYYALRRDEEALAQYRRALDLLATKAEPPAGEMGPLLNNLGMVTNALGDHVAALAYHERALVVYEAAYGPEHPEVAVTLMLIGAQLGDMGEHARAIEQLEQARERVERSLGSEHPRHSEVLHEMGRVLLERNESGRAVDVLERAVAQRVAIGADADSTRFLLARALWAADRDRVRAMDLARDAREGLAERLPVTATSVARIDTWLAERVNNP